MRFHRELLVALVATGLLTVSGPTPAGAVQTTSCTKSYKVVKNDSWSRISTKVKVPMRDLLKMNKATTKSYLLIGDVICLPKTAVIKEDAKPASKVLRLKEPVKRFSKAKSANIIREVFPQKLHARALAIVKRESKFDAAAYNWCCVGLFQLNWWSHRTWLAGMGITSAQDLLDANTNARAALALYKRSNGWGAWG
jgi:LysM repeat protein